MKKTTPNQRIAFDPIQQGVVKRHPDGFGFFIPDNTHIPDVYIPRKFMDSIMTNDRVEVSIKSEPGGDRFRGKVNKLLERSTTTVVGQIYQVNPAVSLLRDESLAWGDDLNVVRTVEEPINDGDWVEVEIITYPGSKEGFTGQVIHHLGDALDPQTDNKRALVLHSVPFEFSREAIEQGETFGTEVAEEDKKDRIDLRDKPFITIDGSTAKDFDDAIFVEKTAKGFKLLVAIADVSHYVKPGSAIDKDAYVRGTSTYFPGFVAPMLPEVLSNELCSLKPNVDRLAFVSEIVLNFQGDITSYKFFEAVIKSHARVTYGEAQEIVDGNEVEKHNHVKDKILLAKDLATILMANRFKNGSLELNVPETIVELDETGQPVDIIKSERLFAHRMIEEMMLIANVAVAKFLTEKQVPALYRIHEEPDEMSIDVLKNYLSTLGVFVPRGGALQKRLTKALQMFDDKPQGVAINILTLRSLSQAKYSPHNVGHFGLGFDDYAHFTSPIRRYPDLIIHRLLKSVVCANKGYQKIALDELNSKGVVLSACEQRSVKAERFVNAIKKARFMDKHVGEEFDGIISSVAKFGVFVQLRKFNVDGLVKIEELASEYLEYDEDNLRLVGKKSGVSYRIGDELKICIANVNIDQGQIDFTLAEGEQKRVKKNVSEEDRPKINFKKKSRKPEKKKRTKVKSENADRRKAKKARKANQKQTKRKKSRSTNPKKTNNKKR